MQALVIPFIVVAGAAQAFATAMSGQMRAGFNNIWLASAIVFAINAFFYASMFALRPLPLPSVASLSAMPWWAPLSGLLGGLAGFAGFLFVDKIGAGVVNGVLLTANIVASVAIDHFALLGVPAHPASAARIAGALLMIAGVALINLF